MLTALLAVLPVFAVIAAGWIAGRLRLLGPNASSELNRFVVLLALPALLFDVVAGADWSALWRPGFVLSFALGSFAIFGATLGILALRGRPLADAAIDGLNAGYANAGYIGFPLCELVFGRGSFALVTMAAILTVTVLFAVAIVLVEIGLEAEARPHRLALKVGGALARNPLVVAPLLGAAWALTRVALPGSVESFLRLLGGAASPCALVSLGLFLGHRSGANGPAEPLAMVLAGLKLVAQPALTALLAYGVFRLPGEVAGVAVLLAALPTGTGPFMLAELYGRDAAVTSGAILASTVMSVASLSACILLIRHFGA